MQQACLLGRRSSLRLGPGWTRQRRGRLQRGWPRSQRSTASAQSTGEVAARERGRVAGAHQSIDALSLGVDSHRERTGSAAREGAGVLG
jgi:hypothetical protein